LTMDRTFIRKIRVSEGPNGERAELPRLLILGRVDSLAGNRDTRQKKRLKKGGGVYRQKPVDLSAMHAKESNSS